MFCAACVKNFLFVFERFTIRLDEIRCMKNISFVCAKMFFLTTAETFIQ